jgi:hypothetical protein
MAQPAGRATVTSGQSRNGDPQRTSLVAETESSYRIASLYKHLNLPDVESADLANPKAINASGSSSAELSALLDGRGTRGARLI